MKSKWHIIRKRIDYDLAGSPEQYYFSPAFYAQYCAVMPLIQRYVKGKAIDLGCGFMPFRGYIADRVTVYHTLDLYPHSSDITFVGDIQNMSMIPAVTYDSALCLEVLEHIPYPLLALREIYRILKPGGVLVLSVPYLSRIHDQPYDYSRFTIYGLRLMLTESGFNVLEIVPKGGLLSFIGHQVSSFLLVLTWPKRRVRQIVWFFNKWAITRLWYQIDKLIGKWDIFPLGYVGVAQKPVNREDLAK
jgi:SAM-dependent methyltransferase